MRRKRRRRRREGWSEEEEKKEEEEGVGNGPRAFLDQASYRSCRDTDPCVGLWLPR